MKKIIQIVLLILISNVSFAQNPTYSWAGTFGSFPNDYGNDIAVDLQGNTYFCGKYENGCDFDPGPGVYTLSAVFTGSSYLCKLSPSGNLLWVKSLVSGSSSWAHSVGLDALGNVCVIGVFSGTVDLDPGPATYTVAGQGAGWASFLTKLDPSGNFIWGRHFTGSGDVKCSSLGLDASNNIYITGQFKSIIDFDPSAGTYTLTTAGNYDPFVCKIDASGNFVWAKNFYGASSIDDFSSSIHIESNGDCFVSGIFTNVLDFDASATTYTLDGGINQNAFIVKLNASGNLAWAKQISCSNAGTVNGGRVRVDALGNVYSVGFFVNDVDLDPGPSTFTYNCQGSTDYYISKLDNSGNFVWGKVLTGTSGGYSISIGLDALNNIYLTGSFDSSIDLDPGTAVVSVTANVGDMFLIKLDQLGNYAWGFHLGGAGIDGGGSMIVDAAHNIYIVGGFEIFMDFNPGPPVNNLASMGQGDIFVLKLSQCYTPTAPANTTPTNYLVCAGVNGTITASSTGTISWHASATGGSALGSGTAFVTPTLSVGNYTYYAEAFTCTNSAVRTPVAFTVAACTEIFEQKENETTVSVYPNPSSGIFTIDIEANANVTVCDVLGKVIYEQKLSAGKRDVDLSEFKNGVYILKSECNGQVKVVRLLKM